MLLSPMKHNICMVFIKLQRHAGLGFIIENPTAVVVEAAVIDVLVCSADKVVFKSVVAADEYKITLKFVVFNKVLFTEKIFVANVKVSTQFEGISSDMDKIKKYWRLLHFDSENVEVFNNDNFIDTSDNAKVVFKSLENKMIKLLSLFMDRLAVNISEIDELELFEMLESL